MKRILLQLWTFLWSWCKHQAPFCRVVIFCFRMLSCRLEMNLKIMVFGKRDLILKIRLGKREWVRLDRWRGERERLGKERKVVIIKGIFQETSCKGSIFSNILRNHFFLDVCVHMITNAITIHGWDWKFKKETLNLNYWIKKKFKRSWKS